MEINRMEDLKGPEEPRVVKLMGSRIQIDAIIVSPTHIQDGVLEHRDDTFS